MATAKLIPLRRNEDLMSEIERLRKVVYDLQDQLSLSHDHLQRSERGVFVNTDAISRFVKTTSVVMIKSDSNYSTIFLEDGTSILTSKTLKYWANKVWELYMQVQTRCIRVITFRNMIKKYLKNWAG